MFDHVTLKVRDLAASIRFYQAALAPLGVVVCSQDASGAGLGPQGAPALWIAKSDASGGPTPIHLAFRAPTRASVDAFHAAALRTDARDHGAPGLRADYAPTYYAAFVLDPDGNNIEAVCLT